MCNFLSVLILRDGSVRHHPLLDSHSDLVRYFEIPDTNAHIPHFAKAELTPVDWADAATWLWKIDERVRPIWLDDVEAAAEQETRAIAQRMVLKDVERTLIVDGTWIVAGNSKIRDVRSGWIRRVQDQATVSDVWGRATVSDVRDQATVSDVRGQATVSDVRGQATVSNVRGRATVSDVRGQATVSNVWGRATVSDVRGQATVSNVWGRATVSNVWGQATVSDVWGRATVSDVWGQATVSDVWDQATVSDVRDQATVSDVRDQARLDDSAKSRLAKSK